MLTEKKNKKVFFHSKRKEINYLKKNEYGVLVYLSDARIKDFKEIQAHKKITKQKRLSWSF